MCVVFILKHAFQGAILSMLFSSDDFLKQSASYDFLEQSAKQSWSFDIFKTKICRNHFDVTGDRGYAIYLQLQDMHA